MNAAIANLLNSIVLIVMGSWGAYATQLESKTALIPVIGGIILLACQKGVKSENKMIAHIAVLLTLILIIGIFRPFSGAMADGDTLGMVRTGAMLVTGVLSMIFFIKSFIDARKAREAQ